MLSSPRDSVKVSGGKAGKAGTSHFEIVGAAAGFRIPSIIR